jgi:hypothetical protein
MNNNGGTEVLAEKTTPSQREHTQGGTIGGQGGHSAKRSDWASLPNHFLVVCDKKEKFASS